MISSEVLLAIFLILMTRLLTLVCSVGNVIRLSLLAVALRSMSCAADLSLSCADAPSPKPCTLRLCLRVLLLALFVYAEKGLSSFVIIMLNIITNIKYCSYAIAYVCDLCRLVKALNARSDPKLPRARSSGCEE